MHSSETLKSEPGLELTRLLSAAPFVELAHGTIVSQTRHGNERWCVCLPVCDEADYLPATLTALSAACLRCDEPGVFVFVINNSNDSSSEVVSRWVATAGVSCLIVDVTFEEPIADAPHARRLALDLGTWLVPDGALLTTDADTVVHTDWIAANLAHLAAGADLVCGEVSVDPQELDGLPDSVRICGDLEAEYLQYLKHLWARGAGGDPPPFAVRAMGASMALDAKKYREVGRLPVPPIAEDKALAEVMIRQGCSVVEPGDVAVTTSCRTQGRARGGMGDALLERSTVLNPLCDEALMPMELVQRRIDLWNQLRWMPEPVVTFLDQCANRQDLTSARMRLDDVKAELKTIRATSLNRLVALR